MTIDIKGMTIGEYLAQGDYWVDDRSGNTFAISEMDGRRRVDAARQLVRTSTALISLAEAEAASRRELLLALRLVRQPPREWVVRTTLYRSLYPEPARALAGDMDNRSNGLSVVQTDTDVLRSA